MDYAGTPLEHPMRLSEVAERGSLAARGAAFVGRALAEDAFESVRGRRVPTPPHDLRMLVGDFGSSLFYRIAGRTFARYCRDLGQLEPTERVLDVGCGCGQVASALTRYLDAHGAYEGFDIIPTLTAWCQTNITSAFPNFHFRHADVANGAYNPAGAWQAASYEFPYADDSFDFVFAKSVFTHLLEDDLRNYFRQIRRVLKDGGRCLITLFLLNEESERNIALGLSRMSFAVPHGLALVADAANAEGAVAYREEDIRVECERAGLRVRGTPKLGSWSGKRDPYQFAFQDMILVY